MRNYLELLQDILDNGTHKSDRTGTGTLSVFGRQLRWDLSEGFPLITTKKMYTRGVIGELLWFIEGSTNARYLEEKWGVKFWREWADEDGELGPVYGQQLRNIKYNFWVKPKIRQQDPEELIHETEFDKKIEIDFTSGHSSFLGKTFDTESGKCTVIKELDTTQKKNRFVVKFHETGYEKVVDYGDVQSHKIADPFATTVFGVGRYGLYEEDEYTACLKDAWREMLRRCYYKKANQYKAYGAKGVHVCKEWLTFANFNSDVRKLTNWSVKAEYPCDYSLDKDIRYASNYYSKETCMWSSREEQSYNTSTNRPFLARDPLGEEHLFNSIGEAKTKHGLNLSAVHRCLNGELHVHHGWHKFNYINREGEVLRARIIDQLKELVAEIKHNPDSRRLAISLYNPHELDKMNLQPCHGNMIQFYVANNKLSCSMYQRSADMFLGVPVNIASYSLLTHIIAQQCNLDVGEFIWTGGDVHIYNNHIEQVKEQLTREPYPLPQLHIKCKPKSIDDYVYEDFEFIGYKHHPAIKAPVSV